MSHFDREKALSGINFFEEVLVHTKGEYSGKPFILLPKWQQPLVERIFGWIDPATGGRQYTDVYQELPKKQGKSEVAAGIANACLVLDKEPGAEIYSAATTKEQASAVFNVAAKMVELSPQLSSILRVVKSTKTIYRRDDWTSFYRAISADGDVQDGINPHCVIVDELHRWKNQKALDLWEVLERSSITRRQPLKFVISTAGTEEDSPLCWRYHEHTRQVTEGIIEDPHFFGNLWGAERSDDWLDPEVWKKANPSHEAHGGFLRHSVLEKMAMRAKNDPLEQQEFKRFHLNIWGQHAERAIDAAKWDRGNQPIELKELFDKPCWIGVDLAAAWDLAAVVCVFPIDNKLYLLPYFFRPSENIKQVELRDKVPYRVWAKQGHLTISDGDCIDYGAVYERIAECRRRFDVLRIGVDPNGAREFMNNLVDQGHKVAKIQQDYHDMGPGTRRFFEMLADNRIIHGGHPILRWNADCVTLRTNGKDQYMPEKPNRGASNKRIDGIQATIIALSASILNAPVSSAAYADAAKVRL